MSTSVPFSSQPASNDEEVKRILALETSGRYIGPMPVEDFLDRFLPHAPSPCPTVASHAFDNVINASPELAMYPQFAQSIGQFAPDLEFVDTHNHACQVDEFSLKPDVSIYARDVRPASVPTDFSTMESWVEFKSNANDDPFVDYDLNKLPDGGEEREDFLADFSFENDTVEGQQIRGQLTAYGLAHLGSQFRNFAFSLLIMGKYVRFMRWERAGVVVSRRLDYSTCPGLLADFFWRLSHLSPAQRGTDCSVEPALSLSTPHAECVIEALRLKPGTPLFEFKVPDGQGTRSYFGPRPPCPSLSLIGRSTRALPVYDLTTDRCVYLKDTWRIDASDIKAEGQVYEELKRANVPHIAPFECGGDVEYRTLTQDLVLADWSCAREPITGHIHYRMVLGVVGRRLSTFRSTKELVQGALDALTAHWMAYEVAKILHRDISSGNIILTDDGRGLLIDWDLSKSLEELKQRRRDRTGTWQFMSAALLRDPEKRHELQDDLESFVHVLAWSTVGYVPNTLLSEERGDYLSMFDEHKFKRGKTVGGSTKAFRLRGNDYVPDELELKHPSPLLDLLKSLGDVFVARYGPEPSEREWAIYEDLLQRADERKLHQTAAVYIHRQRLERLSTSAWFITTFEQFLGSAVWPENDGSVSNVVSSADDIVTSRQQKRNTNHIRSRDIRQESSYHPSQSSHGSKRARSPSQAVGDGLRGKRLRGNTLGG